MKYKLNTNKRNEINEINQLQTNINLKSSNAETDKSRGNKRPKMVQAVLNLDKNDEKR